MSVRSILSLVTLALAGCTIVPSKPADPSSAGPAGPCASRPDCRANPNPASCPSQLHFDCHEDATTGCNVCECARTNGF